MRPGMSETMHYVRRLCEAYAAYHEGELPLREFNEAYNEVLNRVTDLAEPIDTKEQA